MMALTRIAVELLNGRHSRGSRIVRWKLCTRNPFVEGMTYAQSLEARCRDSASQWKEALRGKLLIARRTVLVGLADLRVYL